MSEGARVEQQEVGERQETATEEDLALGVALAQAQTRFVGELQKLVATLLRRIIASLPPSPEELDPEVDLVGVADARSEVRRVLQCALRDDVEPLIDALLTAADYQPPGAQGLVLPGDAGDASEIQSGAPADLTSNTEATRRTLYDLVARDNFAIGPWPASEEDTRHPYSPEEAGLELVHLWGRWFASWWRLEASPDLPEVERREVLLLSESATEPGTLHYHEVED